MAGWIITIFLVLGSLLPSGERDPADAEKPSLTFTHQGYFKLQKPPMRTVFLDVVATNPTKKAVWFFVPTTIFPSQHKLHKISGVGAYRLGETDPYIMFKIDSDQGSYYALFLPPASRLTLTNVDFTDFKEELRRQQTETHWYMADGFRALKQEMNVVLDQRIHKDKTDWEGDFRDLVYVNSCWNEPFVFDSARFKGLRIYQATFDFDPRYPSPPKHLSK